MTDFRHRFVFPGEYESLDHRFAPDETYGRFKKKILFRIHASKGNTYGIMPPNGLLIYGPPCNGKTVLAKQFAQETGFPYIIVGRHDLLDEQGKHTDKLFGELLSISAEMGPCVIILKNVETITPHREKLAHNENYADVMSILSMIKECGRKGVFVFATSSKPWDIDPQLGMPGYLNEPFYIHFPDYDNRLKMIGYLLREIPGHDAINMEYIAEESEDFTMGDIVSLLGEIALNAAFSDRPVDNELVKSTLSEFNHPLASYKRKEYDEVFSRLELKGKQIAKHSIGF